MSELVLDALSAAVIAGTAAVIGLVRRVRNAVRRKD